MLWSLSQLLPAWSLSQLFPAGLVPLSKPLILLVPLSPLVPLPKPLSPLVPPSKPSSPSMPRLVTCGMRLFALAMVERSVSAGCGG